MSRLALSIGLIALALGCQKDDPPLPMFPHDSGLVERVVTDGVPDTEVSGFPDVPLRPEAKDAAVDAADGSTDKGDGGKLDTSFDAKDASSVACHLILQNCPKPDQGCYADETLGGGTFCSASPGTEPPDLGIPCAMQEVCERGSVCAAAMPFEEVTYCASLCDTLATMPCPTGFMCKRLPNYSAQFAGFCMPLGG